MVRIWPFPKVVFVWEYKDCQYDEPLKIYSFGLIDFRFEFKGKSLWFWVEKE
jgi:hypothetical protein